MKNDNKTLSDATRQSTANKANKFAASIMPTPPKSREQAPEPKPDSAIESSVNLSDDVSDTVDSAVQTTSPDQTRTKPEKSKKSGGFTVEDIVNATSRDGDAFNKMVRVTDDHHELLRLMAFKYRKPMNVIVHNLIALLDQAYQKEQKGDQSNA